MPRHPTLPLVLFLVIGFAFPGTPSAIAAETGLSDERLWADAQARIEQHRKADATVVVTDADGKAVAGAEVQVEQIRHAFLFGCNIFAWGRDGDEASQTAYRQRFADVFNFATQPFYWWSYESVRDQPIHERTEQVARWCQQQGVVCKGHPLAWNYAEPRWLPEDSNQILELQLARIDDCVARFGGLIDRWDVVNEATHFDRPDCKARAPKLTAAWAATGQTEFVRRCFQQARQANPKATLLINDYRVDPAYAQLIEKLVDENGKPLYDVIGIQSHQHGGVWNNRKIWETCERFARFGVPLHFTETTIVSGQQGWELAQRGGDWPSTPEGEATQAREVERFYTMLYSHPAVQAITWWDFSDRGAWQRAPAGFLRKDMSPKPAYEVLHRLIKEKWWTRTTVRTDPQGKAAFRGTLGQYRITVTAAGRTPEPQTLELGREQANQITVRTSR
jgi:GH35 family endo-1,4-beta-xylanase